jgi:hypothetical protein
MPQLKNGSEHCDTCGKRYIAILAGDCCQCEIDAAHLTSTEALTGVALKYRQRARVAEELNDVLYKALVKECMKCKATNPKECKICQTSKALSMAEGELK